MKFLLILILKLIFISVFIKNCECKCLKYSPSKCNTTHVLYYCSMNGLFKTLPDICYNEVSFNSKPMMNELQCPKLNEYNCKTHRKFTKLNKCLNHSYCKKDELCCYDFCYKKKNCVKPSNSNIISTTTFTSIIQPTSTDVILEPKTTTVKSKIGLCPKLVDYNCKTHQTFTKLNKCSNSSYCEADERCCYDFCYKKFNCIKISNSNIFSPTSSTSEKTSSTAVTEPTSSGEFTDSTSSSTTTTTTKRTTNKPIQSERRPIFYPPFLNCNSHMINNPHIFCENNNNCENDKLCFYDICYQDNNCLKPVDENVSFSPWNNFTTTKRTITLPQLSIHCPKIEREINCDIYKQNVPHNYCLNDDYCEIDKVCCFDLCYGALNCVTPPANVKNSNETFLTPSIPSSFTTTTRRTITMPTTSSYCPKIEREINCDIYKQNVPHNYCLNDDYCEIDKVCCFDLCYGALNCVTPPANVENSNKTFLTPSIPSSFTTTTRRTITMPTTSSYCPKIEQEINCYIYKQNVPHNYCLNDDYCEIDKVCCFDLCYGALNCVTPPANVEDPDQTFLTPSIPSSFTTTTRRTITRPKQSSYCPKIVHDINCIIYKRNVAYNYCLNDDYCEIDKVCCFDICYEGLNCVKPATEMDSERPLLTTPKTTSTSTKRTIVRPKPSKDCPKRIHELNCNNYMKNVAYNFCPNDDYCPINKLCCYDQCYNNFNCMTPGFGIDLPPASTSTLRTIDTTTTTELTTTLNFTSSEETTNVIPTESSVSVWQFWPFSSESTTEKLTTTEESKSTTAKITNGASGEEIESSTTELSTEETSTENIPTEESSTEEGTNEESSTEERINEESSTEESITLSATSIHPLPPPPSDCPIEYCKHHVNANTTQCSADDECNHEHEECCTCFGEIVDDVNYCIKKDWMCPDNSTYPTGEDCDNYKHNYVYRPCSKEQPCEKENEICCYDPCYEKRMCKMLPQCPHKLTVEPQKRNCKSEKESYISCNDCPNGICCETSCRKENICYMGEEEIIPPA